MAGEKQTVEIELNNDHVTFGSWRTITTFPLRARSCESS